MSRNLLKLSSLILVSALLIAVAPSDSQAKSKELPEADVLIDKAIRSLKSGKPQRALPSVETALGSASEIEQCVRIAESTQSYGTPFLAIRRECMEKALSMCTQRDEYVEVASKCRKLECFDIERKAIDILLKTANSPTELYDLAHRGQQMGASDVSHQALEKAYALCKSVPDALNFAKEANLLGADDLTKKTIKDLIDDETNPHQLMVLLAAIEPYNFTDLDRYLMKKSLDVSSKFEDYVEIADAARRHNEPDIRSIAVYRAKKKRILKQLETDHEKQAQDKANAAAPTAEPAKGSGF